MPTDLRQGEPRGSECVSIDIEVNQLRAEVQRLRTERTLLLERQRSIMELLGTVIPEKIIHDIRNVLNERNLLRTLNEGRF